MPTGEHLKRCVHCVVRGRVQGVAFRAATQATAQRLQLTGWVKNRADGAVETLACGQDSALQSFQEWLHQGPRYAIVTEVRCTERVWEDHSEFRIKL